jgi:hypothetical protein
VKTDSSLHDAGARRHLSLSDLYRGESATVAGLVESAHIDSGRDASQSLITRLRDLVVARMWPGGNPIAVRIGGSTFALRRAEAAAVRVQLAHEPGVARDPGPRAGASAVAA